MPWSSCGTSSSRMERAFVSGLRRSRAGVRGAPARIGRAPVKPVRRSVREAHDARGVNWIEGFSRDILLSSFAGPAVIRAEDKGEQNAGVEAFAPRVGPLRRPLDPPGRLLRARGGIPRPLSSATRPRPRPPSASMPREYVGRRAGEPPRGLSAHLPRHARELRPLRPPRLQGRGRDPIRHHEQRPRRRGGEARLPRLRHRSSEYCDLSTSDGAGWASWLARNRTYLDDSANASINVVMWSLVLDRRA